MNKSKESVGKLMTRLVADTAFVNMAIAKDAADENSLLFLRSVSKHI